MQVTLGNNAEQFRRKPGYITIARSQSGFACTCANRFVGFFRVINIGDVFMLIIKDQTFYFKESKGYK